MNYYCAMKIGNLDKTDKKRNWYLAFTIFFSIGLWASYKWLGLHSGKNLFIPIGLSYYTFQSLGYSISVFWQRLKPTKSFSDYLLFNAFFPQLCAGPIERAENILPQLQSLKEFDYSMLKKGLFLIGLGYFKKLVVADRLLFYYLEFSHHPSEFYGLEYWFMFYGGFILLYFDISGYADIARGLGACFGIRIIENFDRPYLAQNPSEIWQRWHTSISSWMKDFIYFPVMMKTRNIPLSLILVYSFFGFWHAIHIGFIYLGLYWCILQYFYETLKKKNWVPNLSPWINRTLFFNSLVLGAVFISPISIMENIYSIPNGFSPGENFNWLKLFNTDYIIITLGTIFVLYFEKIEKSVLKGGGSFRYAYLLIFLTIVLRYKESHIFFYFRM